MMSRARIADPNATCDFHFDKEVVFMPFDFFEAIGEICLLCQTSAERHRLIARSL
jgi:hypothetical protein